MGGKQKNHIINVEVGIERYFINADRGMIFFVEPATVPATI